MDQADVEGLADAARTRAGFERDEMASPALVAKRLLGRDGLRVAKGLLTPESLSTIGGRQILFVRHLVPFPIAHGLGHWITDREGVAFHSEQERELACDAIGAAIMLPRLVFRKAVRVHNDNWTQLALDFETTETMVALRYGEVIGNPLAVIAPSTLRVRGAEYAWPTTPDQFRKLAKLPALPGMKRARLKDDPRRVVIEAEDVFDDVG